jgi:hypothetical protein
MLNGWLLGVCLREHRPESDAHKAKPQNHFGYLRQTPSIGKNLKVNDLLLTK